MTHYWWMHWFWITVSMNQLIVVAFGHTLLTTIHSNPTTEVSTTDSRSFPEPNTTLIPPKTVSPVVLRNVSLYARNVSFARPQQLDVLPLEVPSTTKNPTAWNNITNRDSTVINQNVNETNVNVTVNLPNSNVSLAPGNYTDNATYLGEDLNYNQSFIQSERIGIEEQDLENEESTGNLSAAGITGITLGCVVVVGLICGVSFFIYHNQGFNRPQVLNDRCSNPDSSGYIDDASVRDNSEEMYSLDNDSFLNSLEAMTIQNYWTDTVKHTKL